mmetsp:Transcript_41983/g.98474  ORF Transcript_41983/g.98474 Transcript_41983/m.98474 type:complete len:203 (-) Transcript_41983:1245-1853(-)|eukprot:1379171-Rhodomonas_salina.4
MASFSLHSAPLSTVHEAEHPSFGFVLPSSQASRSATRYPSPQVVLQTLELCASVALDGPHVHPPSTLHEDEHPSPSAFAPSSHSSEPVRRPSPHPLLQVSGTPLPFTHDHPSSTEHAAEHPSPPSTSPSSQISVWCRVPSPQTARVRSPALLALQELHPPTHCTRTRHSTSVYAGCPPNKLVVAVPSTGTVIHVLEISGLRH